MTEQYIFKCIYTEKEHMMNRGNKTTNSNFLNASIATISFLSLLVFINKFDFTKVLPSYSMMFLPILTILCTGIDKRRSVDNSSKMNISVRLLSLIVIIGCILLLGVLIFEYIGLIKMAVLDEKTNTIGYRFVGNFEPINKLLFKCEILTLKRLLSWYGVLSFLQIVSNAIHFASKHRENVINYELSNKKND